MDDFAKAFANLDNSVKDNKAVQVQRNKRRHISKSDLMNQVMQKWDLPQKYLDFLEENQGSGSYYDGGDNEIIIVNTLHVYGASVLLSRQNGYSFKNEVWGATSGEKIGDWPDYLVVIGDDGADPYVIDLSQSSGVDAPILHAFHGEGEWDFNVVTSSFTEFLKMLEEDETIEKLSKDEVEEIEASEKVNF